MATPPVPPAQLPGVWRADRLGHGGPSTLPSTFPELDAQLPGGGWPAGMLTELIAREPGIGELRLLVPVLRRLTRERKVAVLLGPPHVPYAPAFAAFDIDLDYLIVVQARQAADRLWAVEQTLRSASFGALLAWLPHGRTRPEHLRRMQLAAQGTRGPAFLFRPLPAQFETSPAPLRLLLLPRPGQRLSVQMLKRRGPVLERPLLLELPQPPSVTLPGRPAAPVRGAVPEPRPAGPYGHAARAEAADEAAVPTLAPMHAMPPDVEPAVPLPVGSSRHAH
ncbi:MAG TPA: translesion DNA synthesis-associated protein ImuA [Burkholderiaceae bacterium]|nr:translesion DNA synthesis-associated protein ImuA [Burkholderiaceae bacterium]